MNKNIVYGRAYILPLIELPVHIGHAYKVLHRVVEPVSNFPVGPVFAYERKSNQRNKRYKEQIQGDKTEK